MTGRSYTVLALQLKRHATEPVLLHLFGGERLNQLRAQRDPLSSALRRAVHILGALKVPVVVRAHDVHRPHEVGEGRFLIHHPELQDVVLVLDVDNVLAMSQLHEELEAAFHDRPLEDVVGFVAEPDVEEAVAVVEVDVPDDERQRVGKELPVGHIVQVDFHPTWSRTQVTLQSVQPSPIINCKVMERSKTSVTNCVTKTQHYLRYRDSFLVAFYWQSLQCESVHF